MSEAASEEASKKRRGRKRHDPEDAPVDGDYAKDRVRGVPAGYRAILASDEDIPRMKHRGAFIVNREPGCPVPDYDVGSKDGPVMVDNLTLMLISEENAQRAERPGREQAAQRMKSLRRSATKSGPLARIYEDDGHSAGYSRQRV